MAQHAIVNTPPNYAMPTALRSPGFHSELPTYSPRRSPSTNTSRHSLREDRTKEFEYDIKNRGKTTAMLTLLAEQSYSKHVPTFLQGSPVRGRVYLTAEKLESVQLITVTIHGKIISGADPTQHKTFLEVVQHVWSAEDGLPSRDLGSSNPTSPTTPNWSSASSSSGDTGLPPQGNGRLQHGGYSWNFAVHIPREVSVPYGKNKQLGTFALPETFIDRLSRASIAYEVSVHFMRGKWRSDYRIPVPFGYIPLTRPGPFSTLRQLSYAENAPLLGPTVDLEGWHRVNPITVQGTLFNNRNVSFRCTLFLAKPLSYTRGSLIPLSICFEGDDQQGLDLLSAPGSIDIRLGRRVRYHYDYLNTLGAHHLKDTIDFFDRAVLWPSHEGADDPRHRLRYVNGEIHVKTDAKPTCAIGDFRIEYTVILSLEAPGFEPSEKRPPVLQPVDIVSVYAPGARPKKYAPPGYDLPTVPSFYLAE
ncbi:hypothetical protein HYPSUDRAFT_204546 [Hypholoma sublateritium FD-334 SS-4]|uniref:Arrestin-like N-terminal domain-containing protein n=1 Tax=Hypholoma sublateritium (strain FD-334 SS-4) TaxID=945553 RepID=A0A0D2M863_HYPSF|nr:hypothetical protein HYPSUDRAFT_204546 [Hypholoma sublateritium FD-334 SS-4]